jgi:hypothetical protein
MRLDDDVYVQNMLESREQKSAPKRNFSCSQSLATTPRDSLSGQSLNAQNAQMMVEEYKEHCLSNTYQGCYSQAIEFNYRSVLERCIGTICE